MAETARDPREIITPDAFSVAPELLGTPLARPWRRGLAMGIDLLLIAIIAGLRISWLLLFLALTFLFFQAAIRPTLGAFRKGTRWAVFGPLTVLALVASLIAGYEAFSDFNPLAGLTLSADTSSESGVTEELGIMDAIAVARDVTAVQAASSEAEMTEALTGVARRLLQMQAAPDEIRDVLAALAEAGEELWAGDAVAAALANVGLDTEGVVALADADSLVLAYAASLQAGDSTRADELREPLVEVLAFDRVGALEERNEQLAADLAAKQGQLDAERSRGLINLILKVLNEVGIEFGWSALYFTLLPVVWRGRTPGKRLLRVRIVRLDGKPLGWWAALNRFGGYAASIFTGLLGFLEMFWDDNRQALQDRIAATVVVRETKAQDRSPA
ncbi:MAG: RDD family protein [Gemmatimonadota bacterium]|nr:MAG: RDD family protein [Gemmatimonadota bacterium]